ncbi:MAG: hypothetical protein MGU50_18660 [Trichodesmium sp. MAG_R02]|nr:hypothetical protein [Trichodesmium sp. MAG_R02]
MGIKESEIQLIFDKIISANYSKHQEDCIAVDGKSLKNTLAIGLSGKEFKAIDK